MTTHNVEIGEPTVVRRVYKIQYKQPQRTQRTSNATDSDPATTNTKKMSMKAYDRSTDNDIFALGSAFKSGNFNIDEFLNTFKGNNGQGAGAEDNNQQYTIETEGGNEDQDIGEWSSTNPKSMITTMVSTGPTFVTRRKRIITTIAPSGGTEGDKIVSETTQVLTPDGRIISQSTPNDDLSELLKNQVEPPASPVNQVPRYQDTPSETELPSIEEEPHFEDEVHEPDKGNLDTEDSTVEDDHAEPEDEDAKPCLPNVEAHRDDADSTDDDDDIQFEQDDPQICPCFMRRFRNRKAKSRKQSLPAWAHHGTDGVKGGKIGMTTCDVLTTQGAEEQLLGIQKLIMNYNRMLDVHREQFLEALFRAVKLNGMEVVKILVQLVTRKSIKLSSDEMREPESSATVLHVALLYNHADIVEYLVSINDRDLILATYTNEEYRNQTALHVAVANGNHHLVNLLLNALCHKDRRLIMNTVATGSYFRKNHVDGQLCLSAAAWSSNGEMLTTLASHGAHFALKNLNGDTLLHRLIESSVKYPDKMDYRKMLDFTFKAVGEWASRRNYKTSIADQKALEQKQKQLSTFQKLLNIRNNNGLTPLALSAMRGSAMLAYFMNMEKIYKIPQTKLGSISWVTYDVTDITSFAHGSYNKFSVLHILAHQSGKLSQHVDLDDNPDHSFLDIEPIKSLIEMKWRVYRWLYIVWCIFHAVYIMFFTYFTYEANSCVHAHDPIKENPNVPYVHHQEIYYSMAVFLVVPILYIFLELVDLMGHCPYSIFHMHNMSPLDKVLKRMKSEWVITGNGPYRFVMFGFSAFSIAWYILYILQDNDQDIALAMALLLGWIFVLFFTRGCRVTSRFSIMIQKMFFRDLMYFLAVYIVILASFSFSVNVMYSQFHTGGGMLQVIFYKMMNIITDLDEKQSLTEARHPLFTKMVLVFYAIVAVILLMNMLIAMMNTSYETVRSTRCNLWKQQQLSIMLMLERRFWWLARRSERHIWQKDWEDQLRSYLDVTTGQ